MSNELEQFLQRGDQDPRIRDRIRSARSADEVARIAADFGFMLSVDQIQAPTRGLSDDELDQVAGGGEWWDAFKTWVGAQSIDPAATGGGNDIGGSAHGSTDNSGAGYVSERNGYINNGR